MVTYQGKEVYDVFKGDIIAVKESTYIDFPGRPWHEHFFERTVYYIVKDNMQRNNGTFAARNIHTTTTFFNTVKDNIRIVRRAKVRI